MAIWSGLDIGGIAGTASNAVGMLGAVFGAFLGASDPTAPQTGIADGIQPGSSAANVAIGAESGAAATRPAPAQPTTPATDTAAAVGSGQDANVSATVIGETIVASADPAAQPSAGSAGTKPAAGTAGTDQKTYPAPVFDQIRVEPGGAALIAGRALPGLAVEILGDGKKLGEAMPDARGNFVVFLDLPTEGRPLVLTLRSVTGNGNGVMSEQSVLVTPAPAPEGAEGGTAVATTEGADTTVSGGKPGGAAASAGQIDTAQATQPAASSDSTSAADSTATGGEGSSAAPAVVIADADGVRVLQPGGAPPAAQTNVTIDAISYDTEGEVVLAGRAGRQFVRVYVDNRPIKTLRIEADGSWQTDLAEVTAGIYTLRVDELDEGGKVTSRFETPFKKEFPETAREAAAAAASPATTVADAGNGATSAAISDAAPGTGAAADTLLASNAAVTVQPGFTLWAIAKRNYGDGVQYVKIYQANKAQIRDPDLIYPGQIFAVPD